MPSRGGSSRSEPGTDEPSLGTMLKASGCWRGKRLRADAARCTSDERKQTLCCSGLVEVETLSVKMNSSSL